MKEFRVVLRVRPKKSPHKMKKIQWKKFTEHCSVDQNWLFVRFCISRIGYIAVRPYNARVTE